MGASARTAAKYPLTRLVLCIALVSAERDGFALWSICLSMISAQTRSAFVAGKTAAHFSGSCSSGGRLSHGPDIGGKIEYLSRWMRWIHPGFGA
jgi:hypothetical protein